MKHSIETMVDSLDQAQQSATATDQLSTRFGLSLEDAYMVQQGLFKRRTDRGERIVGFKMGFTSVAKMKQMGVSDQIIGQLSDRMRIGAEGLSLSSFVHPRVEPEIAFRLGAPLSGDISRDHALASIDAVAPAIEIIDSRYRDFKFSLADVIADNSSSAAFAIGQWRDPGLDLSDAHMTMEVGGERFTGSSSAILGDPVLAIVSAARLVKEIGSRLEAGMIILAGAATEAVAIGAPGPVRLDVAALGSVEFTVNP
ncbi:2-keto-4-pentenoate hydratase [Sphingobium phenoxybenzoativorans]|uniref:2-keto-4-pentenoate hydratase n=1 Tax=Sphingobium phenoxybenzoativorans TaxID=1592790 RepID=UPI00209B978D|nr:fumarylacetoacetate hydrolase family protein [Sphingobium phenoxybenzoativorans]